MNTPPDLALIDIHEPVAPPWWPPAPGWWIVAAIVVVLLAWALWRHRHRRLARRRAARLFDDTLAGASTPVQRIAAMSDLLRRASRRRDPAADRLQGEDWLRFLDHGMAPPVFVEGIGRVLLDGGFRRDAADIDLDALQRVVRTRFLDWMAPR